MNWKLLTDTNELEQIDELSKTQAVAIYKHSTRCAISSVAINRLERHNKEQDKLTWYYLDVLKFRDISNAVAQRYQVSHESPQVLLIRNGQCVYHVSHYDIYYEDVLSH